MRITPLTSWISCWLAGSLLLAIIGRADDEHAVLTSVFAKTDKNYKRQKDRDGRWVREYYTMVNGGASDGTIRDSAQDKIKFVSIATVLAQHLARQGYFPATDSEKVDLLIVVNWGRTMPFADPIYRDNVKDVLASMNTMTVSSQAADRAQANVANTSQTGVSLTGSVEEMEEQAADSYLQSMMLTQDMLNRARNQSNARTAHLLGYMGDINQADGPQRYAGGGDRFDDLIADIEEARYYIILSAYDFTSTVRQKQAKIQWVTRMSMRAPGNNFAEKAAAMIAYSSSRFGRDTDGLERKLYPQYKVNLEDVRFLGIAEPAAGKSAAPEQK